MIGADFIPVLSFITGLIAVFLMFFVPFRFKSIIAAFAVALNAFLFSYLAIQVLAHGTFQISLNIGSFLGSVPFVIDALSAWFILIVNFTILTGLFYGIGYLKKYAQREKQLALHWASFVMFQLSMLWVCSLQHAFVFLVAWEIMSLSSMLLVMFEHEKQSTIKAGINYFVQMHISVVFLSIAFIWAYFATGSFSFEALAQVFGNETSNYLFILFFLGFGLKAGFIPLHTWLPHAHPAAPSHVSGVMSGVIVKMGIYGIIRMCFTLQANYTILGEGILVVSLMTGLFGILNAAVHRDYKRMLAYCTIENIGIIGIGIGVGMIGLGTGSVLITFLGFAGALLHTLNHSLFKSLLFFSSGSVYQQTHTRDMDQLGGLQKYMPHTTVLFLVGSLAICGFPPFNGFISEFIIYKAMLAGIMRPGIVQSIIMVLGFAGLSIIGGVSVMTFTKTFSTMFLGAERTSLHEKPHEVSWFMLIPQYAIVAVMISVAVFPGFYIGIIGNMLPAQQNSMASLTDVFHINIYAGLFVLLIVGIWFVRSLFIQKLERSVNQTWGCGYLAPTSKIQYTGKSFTKSLGKILNFLIIERKQYKELKSGEIFPKKRSYASHYFDYFEYRFIDQFVQRLVFAANYFKFIQNGRTQSYVIYGVSFVLLIFIFTFFYFIK